MDRSRVGIVIPAYNEGATIADIVSAAKPWGVPIVVDDCSKDRTAELAEAAGAWVVRHPANRGYDGALDSGFARAREGGLEAVITMDADGQHNPAILGEYIALLDGQADVVLGVRQRRQRFSETVFAWATRLLWGIRDPLCGMKGYRMELHRELGHFDSYKSIGTELALYAAKRGYRIHQIPIHMHDRADGKPRFARVVRANFIILRAMLIGIARRAKWS